MTVTYSAEVATSRGFGCFWKLLFRWRGSIYKLLWPDLVLYLCGYYFLSILYRFGLKENQKRVFEQVSRYCSTYGDLIPVSFVLGFYVSLVVKRWWDSFNCIPWPDSLAFFVSAFVHGQDDRGRLMRRTIMRYVNLGFVITLTCISPCVKKRFPTMDHLVEAGILLPNEKKIMEQMRTTHSTYWMPLVWASSIATRARKEGRIRDDFALKTVIDAIAHYRSLCGGLFNYDWISIPLVYTQVVTLVVYTFFLATLMGRQYLDPVQGYPGYEVDLYIPIFNFLQFFFYMGWLKVAETLVNPFGEDDDDFEVNWVIDRDIQVSYLIVDEMHQEHPELIKDQYWDEEMPDLPYTAAAMPFYTEPPQGSAAALIIPAHEAEFVPFETLIENNEEEMLEEVKVSPYNHPIPVASKDERTRLSRKLSESSQSTVSGFGRSFHPHSQQQKTVLSLLHRLFSRGSRMNIGSNISLQSGFSKRLRKSGSKESNACPTPSSPPTPPECRTLHGFPDDIFYLSDLSLAESRATSVTHSPGIFGTFQVADLFNRRKSDRSDSVRSPQSFLKPHTPGSTSKKDSSDEEGMTTPAVNKKNRKNSLKRFFQSGKFRNSEKSLIRTNSSEMEKKSVCSANTEDSKSLAPDSSEKCNPDESDSVADLEQAAINQKPFSESTADINKRKLSFSSHLSLDKPRASLPYVLDSPVDNERATMRKEPSTLTLIADGEDEFNGNVSSDSSNEITEKISLENVDTASTSGCRRDPNMVSRPKNSSNYPKRTVSLVIHDNASAHGSLRRMFSHRKQHSHEILPNKQFSSSTDLDLVQLKSRLKLKKGSILKKLKIPKHGSSTQDTKSTSSSKDINPNTSNA